MSEIEELQIPLDHWKSGRPVWDDISGYIQLWEKRLRRAIEEEPDVAKRFTQWLERRAAGEQGMPGVRLIFIEQPYLGWAEQVDRVVATAEAALRKQIAAEVEHGPAWD